MNGNLLHVFHEAEFHDSIYPENRCEFFSSEPSLTVDRTSKIYMVLEKAINKIFVCNMYVNKTRRRLRSSLSPPSAMYVLEVVINARKHL